MSSIIPDYCLFPPESKGDHVLDDEAVRLKRQASKKTAPYQMLIMNQQAGIKHIMNYELVWKLADFFKI